MEAMKSRAAALIVCAALALAGWFGGMLLLGNQTDSLTLPAAGMKADTVVMTAGDYDVSAEEYLYWVTLGCDEFYQYYGITDWTLELTEDLTIGDYVKEQADYYAMQFAAVKQLAAEYGVALGAEQQAELKARQEYYVTYYGGEEIYNYMMHYSGLTQELLEQIDAIPYLYTLVCEDLLAEGGALEPTAERLQEFAQSRNAADLSGEELLESYCNTETGAAYDFVNDYINSMTVEKTEHYDAIDVSEFYTALTQARQAMPLPEVE